MRWILKCKLLNCHRHVMVLCFIKSNNEIDRKQLGEVLLRSNVQWTQSCIQTLTQRKEHLLSVHDKEWSQAPPTLQSCQTLCVECWSYSDSDMCCDCEISTWICKSKIYVDGRIVERYNLPVAVSHQLVILLCFKDLTH